MSSADAVPRPRSPLVASTGQDRFFDYCLQPYAPRCDPTGKLRGESLLWNSLEAAGLSELGYEPLQAIRAAAGRDMTVFGVKWFGGRLSWELYFYDPQREDHQITASGLRQALAGVLDIRPRVPDTTRYFMVSFDLDAASLRDARVEELNVYLQFHEGQGGHSYALREDACELRNTYRFHDPKREIDAILHQVQRSMWVDFDTVRLADIVLPELYECAKICVAKKRSADAIYYSGISVDQLRWFLHRFEYPRAVSSFVDQHRAGFDHLMFDVGIDYRSRPDGSLEYPKTGYYSTL